VSEELKEVLRQTHENSPMLTCYNGLSIEKKTVYQHESITKVFQGGVKRVKYQYALSSETSNFRNSCCA